MCFSCLHACKFALLRSCFGEPLCTSKMHFFGHVKTFARHALLLPTGGFRFLNGRHFFYLSSLSRALPISALMSPFFRTIGGIDGNAHPFALHFS